MAFFIGFHNGSIRSHKVECCSISGGSTDSPRVRFAVRRRLRLTRWCYERFNKIRLLKDLTTHPFRPRLVWSSKVCGITFFKEFWLPILIFKGAPVERRNNPPFQITFGLNYKVFGVTFKQFWLPILIFTSAPVLLNQCTVCVYRSRLIFFGSNLFKHFQLLNICVWSW